LIKFGIGVDTKICRATLVLVYILSANGTLLLLLTIYKCGT